MAHGNYNEISLKDKTIGIDNLLNNFDGEKFKAFKDKPKLFFFQSCKIFSSREDNSFICLKDYKDNILAVFPALKGNLKKYIIYNLFI